MAIPQGYQYQQVQQQQRPSCWDKLKMGFIMGCMIGGSTGLIIGSFTTFRFGLRGREAFRQIGKVAAQMGGSFGVFMTVAQGLRC